MRKNTVSLLIIPILALVLHGSAIAPGTTIESFWSSISAPAFTDLENFEWAKPSIESLSKYGIINGYNIDGVPLFRPSALMTRAEFAKIVVCAFGAYLSDAEVEMYDNPRESWPFPYISSAVNTGIAKGYSDEFFGANDNILREDVAVLLKRAIDYAGFDLPETGEKITYSDSDQIEAYATEAVDYFAARGIFKGDEKKNFLPKDFAQRAEIAVLIDRILSIGTPK